MSYKKILDNRRIRKNHGGFGFVPHRFLRDGFLSSLERDEAALYLFYVLATDRYGLSFYGERRICDILGFSPSELRRARDVLAHRDLICRDDPLCQLLELPDRPAVDDSARAGLHSFSGLNRRLRES
ncbi:MAG: hypothetical protein GY866_39290 [Proteobacteria bacterium]|nr:hypothetical protein [Pseudomonadota bacterium]